MNPESLLGSEATTAVPPSVWLSERPPAPARLQKFAARTSSLPFELSVRPFVVRLSDVGRARRFNVPLAAVCTPAGKWKQTLQTVRNGRDGSKFWTT